MDPRDKPLLRRVIIGRSGALALALALLAGCMAMPRSEAPQRSAEPARGEATSARAERASEPAVEGDAEGDADGEAQSAVLPPEILAERRRGDYPEIETDEVGFTITEQVRIAGEARANYNQALLLLRQERYAEGISLLVAVTESAPDVTAPYLDLGIAYGLAGDVENAEQALEAAALLSPDHPIVHNELGILYRRTGRFAEARAAYEKALDVFADFHFARRNLAVLCDLYLADLKCAYEHYSAYLDSVGEDQEVEIWMADISNRLGIEAGQ